MLAEYGFSYVIVFKGKFRGLENRRWATILEFESLRFRHIQSPDYSGLFAFLGHRKTTRGNTLGNGLFCQR
jgi:hypothetical protein